MSPKGKRHESGGDIANGKGNRHRSGNHELMRRGDGGRRGHRVAQRRRRPDDPVRGRIHQERRASCRDCGQEAGHHQSRKHGVFHQAFHGPPAQRGVGGRKACALRSQRRRGGQRRRRRGPQDFHAPRNIGDDPPENEGDRRRLPRRKNHASRRHRARLLQRLPKAGHQGCRQDSRARGAAYHQRAHGRLACVRAGQESRPEDRGL